MAIYCLHDNASDFSIENRNTIINLREGVKGLHNHLALVNPGYEIFFPQNFNDALSHFQEQFKSMTGGSNIVYAKMDARIAHAMDALPTPPVDPWVSHLENLVINALSTS